MRTTKEEPPKRTSFACYHCGSKDHTAPNCSKKPSSPVTRKHDPAVKRVDVQPYTDANDDLVWIPVHKNTLITHGEPSVKQLERLGDLDTQYSIDIDNLPTNFDQLPPVSTTDDNGNKRFDRLCI